MRSLSCILAAGLLAATALHAQTPPKLAVDAAANRHPISPYIYGINEYQDTYTGAHNR